MNKVKTTQHLFFLFILGIFFCNFSSAKAFLSEDLGLDLYKNIDGGLEEFELSQYEYELGGQEQDIATNINRIFRENGEQECIKDNINTNAIKKIVGGDLQTLVNYLTQECYDDNIAINKLNTYSKLLNKVYNDYVTISKEKAKQVYNISRIGLYADGNDENSPFDIISDLKEIDKIIFTQKLEYYGEEDSFLSDYLDFPDSLYDTENSLNRQNNINQNSNTQNNNINNSNNTGSSSSNSPNSGNTLDGNNYICSKNNTNLSSGYISNILNNSTNSTNSGHTSGNGGHIKLPDTNKIKVPRSIYDTGPMSYDGTGYIGVNDNSEWSCNDFFCIEIEFSTYNQPVLGYGESKSIENILNKSNEHLKKAANTDLTPHKMTSRNFELPLINVNLVDMFHMGIVIQEKSPPILNLENMIASSTENSDINSDENTLDKDKTVENMLFKAYGDLGLDYDRKNDINMFLGKDIEAENTISTIGLSPATLIYKQDQLSELYQKKRELNDYTNNLIDKELNDQILTEFYNEFIELEVFIKAIETYTFSLEGLIKKLNAIPIYTN